MNVQTPILHNRTEHLGDYYTRQYMKIIDEPVYKRLEHKTQVITFPIYNNIRNRLSHTHEVEYLSCNIATVLGLDSSLCLAIASGHDVGHAPYAHTGESALKKLTDGRFRHADFSAYILKNIANKGCGLDLDENIIGGILSHSNGSAGLHRKENISEVYNAIIHADKISYILSDVEDTIFLDGVQPNIYPSVDIKKLKNLVGYFGNNRNEQVITLLNIIKNDSLTSGKVMIKDGENKEKLSLLFSYMYEEVYPAINHNLKTDELKKEIFKLYEVFDRSDELKPYSPTIITALLTDKEAKHLYEMVSFNNLAELKIDDFMGLDIEKLLPHIKGKEYLSTK